MSQSLSPIFEQHTAETQLKHAAPSKDAKPFSIRLTTSERNRLKALAGKKPLGTYIRARLLREQAQKRRELRSPIEDDKRLSLLLAMLGESRLASNLNQLAKHANMGSLDVTEEVEAELIKACAAVMAMRDSLLVALGQRPKIRDTDDKP